MPVRNCGAFLQDAIESILNQTYGNLELIIVDDHTSDGSLDAIRFRDTRIIRTTNPGRGIVSALNHACFMARGAFLARMDGDDIALPARFETQVAFLEGNPEIGIVGAQVEMFSDCHGLGSGYEAYERWINDLLTPGDIQRELFIESPIPHPTAMFRRDVLAALGGYRDVQWAEDYDLWLRAYEAKILMAKPEGVLLKWRDRPNRASRTDPRYANDRFILAKCHYLSRTLMRGRNAVIWGAGPTGTKVFDSLTREGITVSGFIEVHPRRIGGRKRGVPVMPMEAVRDFGCALILGAVGSRGARSEIRAFLTSLDKQEGNDFLFVA